MSFISDEIKRIEQRLAELQSALDEAVQLRAVLDNLKKAAAAPTPKDEKETSSKRPYFAKTARVEQIRRYKDEHPNASNTEIARAIGVTPARISQLSAELEAGRPAEPRQKDE